MQMPPSKEFTQACKDAEFFETDAWAVKRILEVEIMTQDVLDPCAGRGVLGRAARDAGYNVLETDLNAWDKQLPGSQIHADIDFLKDHTVVRNALLGHHFRHGGFSVLMNPPFSHACDFVNRSFQLGARKVVMFQRLSFAESGKRRDFYRKNAPARIWICGDRATCWRGDVPAEDILNDAGEVICKGRKGRSVPTTHAWFVWERGHKPAELMDRIWKDGA